MRLRTRLLGVEEHVSVERCTEHPFCAFLRVGGTWDVAGDYHAQGIADDLPRWVVTRPDVSTTEVLIADQQIPAAIIGAIPGTVLATAAVRITEIAWPGWVSDAS